MKRIVSLFLVLCLLLATVPAALGAETKGVTLTSNSAFFNAFTLSKMPKVQSAVNAGDYTLGLTQFCWVISNLSRSMVVEAL